MTIVTGQSLPAGVGEESDVRVRRLSFAQEQLWFLNQLTPGEATYNVVMTWRLRGPLRIDLLQHCLNLVVARHESLRVTFHNDDDGNPYQVVAPAIEVPLQVTDLRALPEAEREQRVLAELDAQHAEPYDLKTGPLCRFRLLRLDAEEYVFCQGFHHIITDGWSSSLINAELSTAYRSLCSGTEPVFDDRTLDYTEFAECQRERLQGSELAEELAFWQRSLANLPALELPADRPRPIGGSQHGETLIKNLSDDLHGIVGQLADECGVSRFMAIAAACNVVLSRYSGLEDIPIGIPMLGRPDPELETVVGMFINMVVLRSDLSGDPTFSELMDRIAESNLDLYDHQEVSFNQVVGAVAPERDPDRNPLFQFSLQLLGGNNSGENLNLPEVVAEFVPPAPVRSRFDISIVITDTGSSLRASVEYSSEMFDSWRMEAMLGHLETVLRTAVADPSQRLSQIPIVAGAEVEQLLSAGRGEVVGISQQWQTSPPIDQPHVNRQIYVVDRSMNLVPRGVAGELLIGGEPDSLTTGDLDHPELTAEKFIDDPFHPGRLVYRSGDLVRWNSDLQIEYLGRIDDQITLRGLRLDLGEIETALTSHPAVGRAVVAARPDHTGETRLIGYVTPAADHVPVPEELRTHLAGSLPEHKIPTAWVVLEEFPLSAGSTIDRDALPDPAGSGTGEDSRDEPSTPTEQSIAEIFGVVLSRPIQAEDSFFEAGGDSLQALRAVSRINKTFGIKLSVRKLYGNATVRAISAVVDEEVGGKPA